MAMSYDRWTNKKRTGQDSCYCRRRDSDNRIHRAGGGAFAASTDANLPPEYGELLGLAQQKVQAATQPGAFGNGVPVLYGADPVTMIPWIGVAISVALAAVCAVKLLAPRIRNGVLPIP
jgi:hypothetical protein